MVRKDICEFLKTIPKGITLVAASKYADIDDMKILLESGIHDFGENRVDSFLNKYEALKQYDIIFENWKYCIMRNKSYTFQATKINT